MRDTDLWTIIGFVVAIFGLSFIIHMTYVTAGGHIVEDCVDYGAFKHRGEIYECRKLEQKP